MLPFSFIETWTYTNAAAGPPVAHNISMTAIVEQMKEEMALQISEVYLDGLFHKYNKKGSIDPP